MRLDLASWYEVEAYLRRREVILLPLGSTEQHGPIGLIGTDALCAETIARQAGEQANVYVAPTLAYTPAPFNTGFPGTVSLSEASFETLLEEILTGLDRQGFHAIYLLNGHGANLAPAKRVAERAPARCRIRSWWDFETVNQLRRDLYGEWEGMHATPSEVAITQACHRILTSPLAEQPPRRLSPGYIKAHAGDRHGPPDRHRAEFPDGRVGSHSALASPEHGRQLIARAVAALVDDLLAFSPGPGPS